MTNEGSEKGPELVDHLIYDKEPGGIVWIKFNMPETVNALYGRSNVKGTVAKVGEYMRAADDDPEVRVIVLTGVGKHFCAGVNLKTRATEEEVGPQVPGSMGSLLEGPDAIRQYFFYAFSKLHRDISLIRKPTIAMINGAAVGSGMDMALHCDIRIGTERTRFMGYQQAGQIMENGACYYLPKMIGLGRALEFAYTGSLSGRKAFEWGMLNHLVEEDELQTFTRDLCQRIIDQPPLVQWISKRVMRAALDSSMETTMVMTSNAGGILHHSEDAAEARDAFKEKRKPDFKGR